MNELKVNNKPVTETFDICEILNNFFYLYRPFSSLAVTKWIYITPATYYGSGSFLKSKISYLHITPLDFIIFPAYFIEKKRDSNFRFPVSYHQ